MLPRIVRGLFLGLVLSLLATCTPDNGFDWFSRAYDEAMYGRGVCTEETTPRLDSTSIDATICPSSVTGLSWAPIEGADRYVIQFSLADTRPEVRGEPSVVAGFDTVAFEESTTAPQLTPAEFRAAFERYAGSAPEGVDLQGEVTFFYHVASRGRSPAGTACTSRFSELTTVTSSLVVDPVPTFPIGATFCVSEPSFTWETSTDLFGDPALLQATAAFNLEIARDPEFSDVVVERAGLSANTGLTATMDGDGLVWDYTLDESLANRTAPGYYWRVSF